MAFKKLGKKIAARNKRRAKTKKAKSGFSL